MALLQSSKLREKTDQKIAEIAAIADLLPVVVVIHNIQQNLAVEYMSARGLRQLGITWEELQTMGLEYYTRFFNPIDAEDYVPKLMKGLLDLNDPEEAISYFQQVRFHDQEEWMLHLSTTKILMQDERGRPLLIITSAVAMDPLHHITSKVNRVMEENTFLRMNSCRFSQLGSREREVLKHVALGKSSQEIADEMFISEKTVNTHRRNIKVKLSAHTSFDFAQYARAFDLI